MGSRIFLNNLTITRSLKILDRRDRKKIYKIILIQNLLAVLDFAGIAAIGIVSVLAIRGFGAKPIGGKVEQITIFLRISNLPLQVQVGILGAFAVLMLVSKTILSIFFSKRILKFLSTRAAVISAELISKLMKQPLLYIQSKSTQQFIWALTAGVTTITIGIIGLTVNLLGDFGLLIVLLTTLFLVNASVAIMACVFFGIVGLSLFKYLNGKARELGFQDSQLNIQSNEKIMEILKSFREIYVKDRQDFYTDEMYKIRFSLAKTQSELAFIPYMSKYVIETSIVIGALVISASQLLISNSVHAFASLSIFLAAGTRIAPAVLRIQQGAINIKSSLGLASPTLELIKEIGNKSKQELVKDVTTLDMTYPGFKGSIRIKKISFRYPQSESLVLNGISMDIEEGQNIAIIGKSGSGKTTLIDVMLGILKPNIGKALISELPPEIAVAKWAGAISYFPQEIFIIDGSIKENVIFGYEKDRFKEEEIWQALRFASLEKMVANSPEGLETKVGENGINLSGGQRQRLGIARAMITKPKLIIMDESTNSLDPQTEEAITRALLLLKGKTTVVTIAHKLSTIKMADYIYYLDNGQITHHGTIKDSEKILDHFNVQ